MSIILLDLENTLLHRTHSIESFARALLNDFSCHLHSNTPQQVEQVIISSEKTNNRSSKTTFTTAKETIANALATKLHWKTPVPIEQLERYWAEQYPLHACPMPGAKQLLESLQDKKHTVAIVSNGSHASRETMMNTLGFTPLVQALFSSELLATRKPDGQIFKTAIERLGGTCEAAFHIGDHPFNDILGAQRVGITPIWLQGCHTWPNHIPTPKYKVSHLNDVMTIIHHRQPAQPTPHTEAKRYPKGSRPQFA